MCAFSRKSIGSGEMFIFVPQLVDPPTYSQDNFPNGYDIGVMLVGFNSPRGPVGFFLGSAGVVRLAEPVPEGEAPADAWATGAMEKSSQK